MNLVVKQFVFLLLLCFVLSSCESEYSKVVKRELKSGVIHDDLIFGMKLGETLKDFYSVCWDLNKQKIISQGSGNKFAKYTMQMDSMVENSDKVEMLFYGIFDQNKVMHGMHMKMSYLKWAPWNEQYHAEALIEKLKKKYMREYDGNPFIEIDIDEKQKAFAKVDGNRQILMYRTSDKDVTVKIQDLRKPKEPSK